MRRLRVAFAIPAFALVLCALLAPVIYAAGEEFVESFSTKLFCDTLNTTAWWDTGAGELKLYPFALTLAGSYDTPGNASSVALSGNYAYVADGDSLQVIDITNPASPVPVGSCTTTGDALAVAVSGDYAYVAAYEWGLLVIDISNPAGPVMVANCEIPGFSITGKVGIAVLGNYLYLGLCGGFEIVDITYPYAPVDVIGVPVGVLGSCVRGIAISGDHAYVQTDAFAFELDVFDISDPTNPMPDGYCSVPGSPGGIAVSGEYAYVACYEWGLVVYDISDPFEPVCVGYCFTPGNSAVGVAVSGDYAYVADNAAGLQVIDIANPAAPVRTGRYDTPGNAVETAISGEYAYVADSGSGLQVIHVADPSTPALAGSSGMPPGTAYNCAVAGDYAFVAAYGSGLHVVDITNPTAPVLRGSCNDPSSARGVAVDGEYAFVANGPSGLQVIDISNPTMPAFAGNYDTPGNTYGVALDGDYAFLADGAAGLKVVDITDPAVPSLLGSCGTMGEARAVCVAGDYVYVAEGDFGVEVISVSDPSLPSPAGSYDTPAGFAYWITVAGDLAFVANGDDGFLVLDITNPVAPVPAGWLDTWSAYGLTVDGDFAFLADGDAGFEVIEVFKRSFQEDENRGQSLVLFESDKEISAVRFTPAQTDSIYWYASADSGVSWTYVPADTFWHQVGVPGYELAWRAELFLRAYHVNPTCTSVGIEWKYNPALIDTVLDVPQDEGGWARVRFESSGLDLASQGTLTVKNYYIHRRIDDIGFTDELKEKGERIDGSVPIALEQGTEPGTGAGAGAGAGATSGDAPEPVPVFFPGADAYLLNGRYYFVSFMPVSGGLPPGTWEVVTGVPALQEYAYYSLVPTRADSMSTFEYTVYCVTAHTDESTVYYVSPPDSGYSRDNLAPQPPADLKGDYAYPPAELVLAWDRNHERDLSHYAVYKGDNPDFIPSQGNLIGVPWDTSLVDETFDPDASNYYKVSAWDIHENEGSFSLLAPEDISHVENPPPVPTLTRLEQNSPNPFNPATVIKFSVARPGWVTLRVYDVTGRGVRTVVARVMDTGWYEEMWDGRDDGGRSVPSGVYVYELQAPLHREARKMVLIR